MKTKKKVATTKKTVKKKVSKAPAKKLTKKPAKKKVARKAVKKAKPSKYFSVTITSNVIRKSAELVVLEHANTHGLSEAQITKNMNMFLEKGDATRARRDVVKALK